MDWRINFICCPHVKRMRGIQKIYVYKMRACCKKCRKEGYLNPDTVLEISEHELEKRFLGIIRKLK